MVLWQQKNKDKATQSSINWQKKYPDKVNIKNKRWKKNNKDKTSKAFKKKYCNNIQFKLAHLLRGRIWKAIKNNQKTGSAVKDLGCSIQELKVYLESKFTEGMNWDNWSNNGWHIDHIIPLASFDLTNREEFLKACHYTNLQPLWAKDNILKSNKI